MKYVLFFTVISELISTSPATKIFVSHGTGIPSSYRPADEKASTDTQNTGYLMRSFFLLALLSFACSESQTGTDTSSAGPSASSATADDATQYVVKRGDYLTKIGVNLNVPWEAIFLTNEAALTERAEARCSKLSPGYTNRRSRKGHYCNELLKLNGKSMVAPNSLQPGDVLVIPSVVASEAPVKITSAVSSIKGKTIVLVIDDTGSMSEDRLTVSSWYMSQIAGSGKKVVKVILYADGYVRELDPQGQIDMRTTGETENTYAALKAAATYNPDAIVLVTDEPGDDWGMTWLGVGSLPPVVAHSLDYSADANLKEVASRTGGTFVSGI